MSTCGRSRSGRAFAASQPYAEDGPRSSSVAQRCSEWPGGATQRGIGMAREELGLLGVRAESGDHDQVESRPAAPPPPSGRRRPPRRGASPRRRDRRAAPSSRRPRPAPASRSRSETGADASATADGDHPDGPVAPSALAAGELLRDRSRPITVARPAAAGWRPRPERRAQAARVDPVAPRGVDRREPSAGEVVGLGEVTRVRTPVREPLAGASSLGTSSRMLRAAERAARSAALCTLPLPVAAPPIAASARAARIRIRPAPSSAGSAWPAVAAREGCAAQTEQPPRDPAGASRRSGRPDGPRPAPAGPRTPAAAGWRCGGDPPPRQLIHRQRRQRALGRQRDEQAAAVRPQSCARARAPRACPARGRPRARRPMSRAAPAPPRSARRPADGRWQT